MDAETKRYIDSKLAQLEKKLLSAIKKRDEEKKGKKG